MSDLHKQMNLLVAKAEQAGWRVSRPKAGHIRLAPPDKSKRVVFTGNTPSDHRALKNFRAQLRRHGLEV